MEAQGLHQVLATYLNTVYRCIQLDRMDIGSKGCEWYINGKLFEPLSLLSDRRGDNSVVHQYGLCAKNYMENSYMEQVTVERTAGYLGLNRSYFCRLFHKHQGCSPGQYLLGLRPAPRRRTALLGRVQCL